MKKFFAFVVASMLLSGAAMQAQDIKWSVEGGYLGSKVSASVSGVSGSVDFNGFYAGVGADFAMKAENLSIASGLFWDYKSMDLGIGDLKANYLRIPVQLKYTHPVSESFKFFVSAGPSVNIGTFGKAKANELASMYGIDDADASNDKVFGKDALKRIHVQVGANIGVVISDKFIISLGYDYGLTKGMDVGFTNRINAIKIGVGYSF